MDKAQSDLVEWYKLETEFFPDYVRHTRYVEAAKNRNEKVKEDWSNCGELGKGGFGVVNKQIKETTGKYRAVKTIDKSSTPEIDYSRELLVMAILAKRPSLFVEFLGWFEEPKTLYVAMEYLPEGDLTKHIGAPLPQETVQNISMQILEGLEVMHQHGIAHRDLKPANIFVVRMSPVWIKIGDFGISKRILAQDTTTLHTQVSTQSYSAPEVIGLDSNSESSGYTDSVDIWSLGCVVYELLVGTKLFGSWGQVSLYYFGKSPFPEDKLKALSPPTDDMGILFLKSVLAIQPGDRPTAANALRHEWLAGTKGDNVDGIYDQDETTKRQDDCTWNRKSESELATHDKPKKRRRKRKLVTRDDSKHTAGDLSLGANSGSRRGSHSNTRNSANGTSLMARPDVASIGSSLIQTGPLHSELISHNFQATQSKGPKVRGKKQVHNISQTPPQDLQQEIPRRQTFAVEIVLNRPLGQMATLNTPQCTNRTPPSPSPITLRDGFSAGEPALPGRAGSGKTIRKLQRTRPRKTPPRISAIGGAAETTTPTYPRKIPNTGPNPIAGQDLNAGHNLNVGRNPIAGWGPSTGGSQSPGWNPNH
ncbi:kinase-like domain-containing protein [Tuber indicum]|nr:kinase-like domain-containing protein [Tuber indicum]